MTIYDIYGLINWWCVNIFSDNYFPLLFYFKVYFSFDSICDTYGFESNLWLEKRSNDFASCLLQKKIVSK